jgi:hypothetical protein
MCDKRTLYLWFLNIFMLMVVFNVSFCKCKTREFRGHVFNRKIIRTYAHAYVRADTKKNTHTQKRTHTKYSLASKWLAQYCTSTLKMEQHLPHSPYHRRMISRNVSTKHSTCYRTSMLYNIQGFHKQLPKYSIEFSLSSIILVQNPTQIEMDIPEIFPGFRCDTTLCVYSVKCYGISHNNYRNCLVNKTAVH